MTIQIGRPSGLLPDGEGGVYDGNWKPSAPPAPFHSKLADDSDATFVASGGDPAGDEFRVRLADADGSPLKKPAAGTIAFDVRLRGTTDDPALEATLALYEGSREITSLTVEAGTGWATHIVTLTQAQANSIVHHDDLRVHVTADVAE